MAGRYGLHGALNEHRFPGSIQPAPQLVVTLLRQRPFQLKAKLAPAGIPGSVMLARYDAEIKRTRADNVLDIGEAPGAGFLRLLGLVYDPVSSDSDHALGTIKASQQLCRNLPDWCDILVRSEEHTSELQSHSS